MIVLRIYKTIYNKDNSITLQSTLSDCARIWQINFNVDKLTYYHLKTRRCICLTTVN